MKTGAPARTATLAVTVALGLTMSACSGSAPGVGASWVAIEVELGDTRQWSASGPWVRSGRLCDGGSHRWIGYRAQDGSPIEYSDGADLKQLQPELVLLETEHACADGKGSISIAWEPDHDDRWIIVDGTGTYAGASGGGSLTGLFGAHTSDSSVTLEGETSGR